MIVDASVALKWLLLEEDSGRARALLDRTDLAAPDCLGLEIASALTRLVRRKRVGTADARRAWAVTQQLPLSLIDWSTQAEGAFALSLKLGAGFYDCLYLALAVARDDVMVTADSRFARAVRADAELSPSILLLSA